MVVVANSNGESNFHPDHAAALLLLALSAGGKGHPFNAAPENRRGIVRHGGFIFYRRDDSNAHRRRRAAQHHLAGLGVRGPDRWRNTRLADTSRVFLHPGTGETQITVMCTYLLAVSLGNQFTAAVDFFIQNPDGTVKLHGASYFMFFVWVLLGTAVLFVIVTPFYKGRTYLQDQAEASIEAETTVGFAVQPEA